MSFQIQQNITNVNCEWGANNPQWLVIHNTANGTSREGTAYANTCYFKNQNRNASAHYFVDDGDTIWQCVNDGDTAWHVGDSWSHNGCTNYNSIGIEVCETADGSFTAHEIQVLSWLVPMLMDRYGIPASRVCRHHDVTGKICPAGYIDAGRWQQLKDQITTGKGAKVVLDWEDYQHIAEAIWAFKPSGGDTQAQDMITGINAASNNVNNSIKDGWLWDGLLNKRFGDPASTFGEKVVGTDAAANNVNNHLPELLNK